MATYGALESGMSNHRCLSFVESQAPLCCCKQQVKKFDTLIEKINDSGPC